MTLYPYVDEDQHTLSEYLALYRGGKVGPLQHKAPRVPVVPCRSCGISRPDDGTRCSSCGAYQRCSFDSTGAVALPETFGDLGPAEQLPERPARPAAKSTINPRRRKKHHA